MRRQNSTDSQRYMLTGQSALGKQQQAGQPERRVAHEPERQAGKCSEAAGRGTGRGWPKGPSQRNSRIPGGSDGVCGWAKMECTTEAARLAGMWLICSSARLNKPSHPGQSRGAEAGVLAAGAQVEILSLGNSAALEITVSTLKIPRFTEPVT